MRLIDADAAIDALKEQADAMSTWIAERYKQQSRGVRTAINIIKDLPTIEPRRKGKWVVPKGDNYGVIAPTECDQCGFRPQSMRRFFYCPNCGADMREEE